MPKPTTPQTPEVGTLVMVAIIPGAPRAIGEVVAVFTGPPAPMQRTNGPVDWVSLKVFTPMGIKEADIQAIGVQPFDIDLGLTNLLEGIAKRQGM
jgi:hypothetical protein